MCDNKDPFTTYEIKKFFHFTDKRNLKMIRDLGGLYSLANLKLMGLEIPAPGGDDWSHDADSRKELDKYVHLCFRPHHPMLFRAMQDGRIKTAVYLEIRPDVLHLDGVKCTTDVSNKTGVKILSIDEAKGVLDFEVLYTRMDWNNSAVNARLCQAEKYELLVPDFLPLSLIRNMPNG